jgi:hypothetical protein
MFESLDYLYVPAPDIEAALQSFSEAMKAWALLVHGEPFEIPEGPCCALRDPAGNELAVYEKRRNVSFDGRFD